LKTITAERSARVTVASLLLLWAGLLLPSPLRSQTTRAPLLLTQVKQIRALSQQQAATAAPVKLTGVITDLSGWKNSFFFQDSTAGISVDRTDNADVHVGDMVELTGVSNPGWFAPTIVASNVRVIGHASPPTPLRVTFADMAAGAQDSRWIEVQGIVHSIRFARTFTHDTLLLRLELGGGPVTVILQDFAGLDVSRLIDSTVRIRGVSSTTFNEKRQFVGLGMFVPDRRDLEIVQLAASDPFAAPGSPVRNALQFGQGSHRVKVTGIATYQVPGHTLYLQDGEDGIQVQTSSTQLVEPGQKVEALGFPVIGEYSPILVDGLFRVIGTAAPVTPVHITAADVITQKVGFNLVPNDQQLVQLEGKLVESHIHGGQRIWILREGAEVFEAYAPLSAATARMDSIGNGSVLSLTGVCSVQTDIDRNPVSFSILLRSSKDIVILQRAPWWTPSHSLLLLASLAIITAVIILWVVVLRHRVEHQTRTIRESEGRFRNLAEQDVLTGLPNRLCLNERIEQSLALSRENLRKAVVFTIDVDRFKQINDTHGHPVGDECLKVVATRLRTIVRGVDTIARTGGEEFTIVVGNLTNPESARRISSAILRLFQEPIILLGNEVKLTISVGGAIYPDDGVDTQTLLKRSDQALYEAKRTGRNRAVFANEELCGAIESATVIEVALRDALQTNEFKLFYQPICDSSGTVHHFEALLRTSNATLAALGPAQFIPIAEATGLIVPLGRWVIEEACRQIAEWHSMGVDSCPVAVNISGKQLLQQAFANDVLQVLERFHLKPELLEFEMTETTVMADIAAVLEPIAQLARAGLAFAIDDFGTGHSSLARLHQLPINSLKIDRSFVVSLEKNNGFHTIVLAIIQMAKSLDLQVVAEGVETREQFNTLRNLGCDFFQGYLFARPMPAELAMQALTGNAAALAIGA
jgi:diguanylate cyclase (GGDEF)-like protein